MTKANDPSNSPRHAPARKPRFPDRPRISVLTEDQAKALKVLNPANVYMAGANEFVPRFIGDTKGATPCYVGRSQRWADTVSSTLDRYSPTFAQTLWFRLWVKSPEAAKRLEAEIPQHLGDKLKKLRGKAFDVDPNVTLDDLQFEIMSLAESLGIETFDDDQLLAKIRSSAPDANA